MRDICIKKLQGREHIDSLAHLYRQLDDHQAAVAPVLGHVPRRTAAESWERRRTAYADWLGVPGAFVLLAERGEHAVGYALVTFASAYHGWRSGEQVAELKDIAVESELRGQGIGSRLMDSVDRELAAMGISEYRLSVVAGNEAAMRLYRRRGMDPVSTVLLGRVGGHK